MTAASTEGARGLTVVVDPSGAYDITVREPAWRFGGEVGGPLANLTVAEGTDGTGAFAEISFDETAPGGRHCSLRNYRNRSAVLFSVEYRAATANTTAFPVLTRYPRNVSHLNFVGMFATPSFRGYSPEGPWAFFDSAANAFILSPAANFMTASTAWGKDYEIVSGIMPGIAILPEGFTHRTLLIAEPGINRAFDSWGRALTDLQGKTRPPNDADASLNRLGYWTNNGAAYYYRTAPSTSYPDTLRAVKEDLALAGVALGYVQLDSWFYSKGETGAWGDGGGIWDYTASPALFREGLQAFQRQLGLPLIAHARWIDAKSPLRQEYQMSGGVAVDPRYWDRVTRYLAGAGVATYEQDWLALAAYADFNLTDPDAFMDNMAAAAVRQHMTMQYCMATPRHLLQSSKYGALTTARVSPDRFNRGAWTNFLYASRLASALGVFPFSDVFLSGETENLLVATLSAGPLGIGDAIGRFDGPGLLRAVRPDGVIVKPDVPLTPIDASYVGDGALKGLPMTASTYSEFDGVKTHYVLAYRQASGDATGFRLDDIGLRTPAYVYNYFTGRGRLAGAGDVVTEDTPADVLYYIAAPVGPSGIAMLGDSGHFVSMGHKRVSAMRDDGTIHLTLAFAAGEAQRTIHGYAPKAPGVTVLEGAAGEVAYDGATQRFSVALSPSTSGLASVELTPASPPTPNPPR